MSNTQDLRRASFSEACAERDAITDQVKPLRSARRYHRKAQVHASKADPVTAQIKELEKPLFDLHNEIASIISAGIMVMITLRGDVAKIGASCISRKTSASCATVTGSSRPATRRGSTGNIRDPAAGRRSGKSVPCHHFRVDHSLGRVAG